MKITECPRDAMQGIASFIPTEEKLDYLKSLLSCGFDRIDIGSFVSDKVIPQLADTSEILEEIGSNSLTQLLVIVANEKGLQRALDHNNVDYIGYPFSVSEQFQVRNTNATIEQSKERLKRISDSLGGTNKTLLVYLSMGFGNPYGDPWSEEHVLTLAKELYETMGISHFALSDTIGCATPSMIERLYPYLSNALVGVELGLHLHTKPEDAKAILTSAFKVGCQRMDSALLGIGGCPMASDHLTGNLATEQLISVLEENNISHRINNTFFTVAKEKANRLFSKYQ